MSKRVLGYYDYTVVLTYCGLLFAFGGIICSIHGNYTEALACLMITGLCDTFDGAVASTKDRTASEKRFGVQIDSLCDLIGFGVLPGIFVYIIAGQKPYLAVIASMYVLASVIRLAYFNVMEEERQQQTTDRRSYYNGVPVTVVAFLLPVVYMIAVNAPGECVVCYPITLVVLLIGFVSTIKIGKPKWVKYLGAGLGLVEMIAMILMMLNR